MHKFQKIKRRTSLFLICLWIFLFGFFVFQIAGLMDDDTTNDEQAAENFLATPLPPLSESWNTAIASSLVSLPHLISTNIFSLYGDNVCPFFSFLSLYQTIPSCRHAKLFELFSNYRI